MKIFLQKYKLFYFVRLIKHSINGILVFRIRDFYMKNSITCILHSLKISREKILFLPKKMRKTRSFATKKLFPRHLCRFYLQTRRRRQRLTWPVAGSSQPRSGSSTGTSRRPLKLLTNYNQRLFRPSVSHCLREAAKKFLFQWGKGLRGRTTKTIFFGGWGFPNPIRSKTNFDSAQRMICGRRPLNLFLDTELQGVSNTFIAKVIVS